MLALFDAAKDRRKSEGEAAEQVGRPHKALTNPYPRTRAMAAGLADYIWTCEEMAALLD